MQSKTVTLLSKDTYKSMVKIVEVGTKKVNVPAVTPPATQDTVITDSTI